MIGLTPPTLPNRPAGYLTRWTTELTDEADFTARVALAKKRFKSRNKKGNKTFDAVKVALYAMCNETWRCVYCEDNFADEVEHIRPKDIYPEQCFAWTNYVYACGPCNGPKNNHFAVVDGNGVEHDVTPPRPAPAVRTPPVAGTALLIDPRVEDPMTLLALDLGTGGLAPLPGLGALDRRRAEWTRDTLGLNSRRLPRARKLAIGTFRARLKEYADERDGGASSATLDVLRTEILGLDHQTVLREMQRQAPADPVLQPLFARLPEVATWW